MTPFTNPDLKPQNTHRHGLTPFHDLKPQNTHRHGLTPFYFSFSFSFFDPFLFSPPNPPRRKLVLPVDNLPARRHPAAGMSAGALPVPARPRSVRHLRGAANRRREKSNSYQ
jgi:hypothetical protein